MVCSLNPTHLAASPPFAGARTCSFRNARRHAIEPPVANADSTDVYANPPDIDRLELEPGHPGLGDDAYIQRRHDLFAICREHRLRGLPPPVIDYTDEEERIWREVTPRLDQLHVKHASSHLPGGEAGAGDQRGRDPAAPRPQRSPPEGERACTWCRRRAPIPYKTFYSYIAKRGFPVTQFIRHGSQPEFTPEPDMIHDCLGPRAAAHEPRLRRAADLSARPR